MTSKKLNAVSYLIHFALALGCFALAGCGTVPIATQTVDIPVFTPCVKEVPLKPDFEFGKLSITDSEGAKILALARDWPRGRSYEEKLEAALAGCL